MMALFCRRLFLLSDRNLKTLVGAPWGNRRPEPYFDKEIEVYPFNEHEGGGGHQFVRQVPWLAALAEGAAPSTPLDGM